MGEISELRLGFGDDDRDDLFFWNPAAPPGQRHAWRLNDRKLGELVCDFCGESAAFMALGTYSDSGRGEAGEDAALRHCRDCEDNAAAHLGCEPAVRLPLEQVREVAEVMAVMLPADGRSRALLMLSRLEDN